MRRRERGGGDGGWPPGTDRIDVLIVVVTCVAKHSTFPMPVDPMPCKILYVTTLHQAASWFHCCRMTLA